MGVGVMPGDAAMTVAEILALSNHRQVQGQYVVRESELRGSEGRYFLRLLLGDKTGSIQAYVWNYDVTQRSPKVGDVVQLQGVRGEFQSKPKVDIQWGGIRRGTIPIHELIELPEIPGFAREHWAEIDRIFTEEVTNEHLSRWARHFLDNDGFREQFILWPAAKTNHHAYPGGLVRHTLYVMRVCRQAAREMYPHLLTPVGYQLLLFAAFFHDAGKLEELGLHPVTGDVFYTDRGQRFGHILLGRDMLLKAARQLEVPRDLMDRVDELILGHQGKKEWDTPREPLTLEGIILSAADYFDSQIGNMEMALQGYREGVGENYQFVRPFGRHMYLADAPERQEHNLVDEFGDVVGESTP